MRAEKAGNDAKNTFIDQRLLTTAIDFFDSIKNEIANDGNLIKIQTNEHPGKRRQIQRASRHCISDISEMSSVSQTNQHRQAHVLFCYNHAPLTWNTRWLFVQNRSIKNSSLPYLTKDLEPPNFPPDAETLYVEDGDALMYTLNLIPANFRLIAIVIDLLQKKSN